MLKERRAQRAREEEERRQQLRREHEQQRRQEEAALNAEISVRARGEGGGEACVRACVRACMCMCVCVCLCVLDVWIGFHGHDSLLCLQLCRKSVNERQRKKPHGYVLK